MDKLLAYLNSLSPADREAFAVKCGTTVGYIRRACSGGLALKAQTCVLIERESGGAVSRKDLRPNDWLETWPELQGAA